MLVTIEGKKGEERPITTSLKVAEVFNKQHKDVLRAIDNLVSEMAAESQSAKLRSDMFFKTTYKAEEGGRNYPLYFMNRDGFALVVMGFTGAEATKWKLKYIAAFNEMEATLKRIYEERKQWEIERAKGVLVRHILTDTIKNVLPESPHKNFMYSNYTKLIYKVIFDKTVEELRADLKIQKSESIRDNLTKEEIAEVENLERLTTGLINLGWSWSYERIKDFLESNVHQKMAASK